MANPELSPMKLGIAPDLGPAMDYSTYIIYLASIMKYLLRLLTQRHWRDRIHGMNAIMGIGHVACSHPDVAPSLRLGCTATGESAASGIHRYFLLSTS